MRNREIAFRSQGVILRGYLITPVSLPGSQKPPVVILSHGFSATQHMGLLDTARAVCRHTGCAALTFDHGGFGESDGERHYFCMWTQATGYLDAVTYVQQAEAEHVDVARICLWGESLSSRLALVAAAVEPMVKAVILVTPPCGRRVEDWTAEPGTVLRRESDGDISGLLEATLATGDHAGRKSRDRVASDTSAASDISSASDVARLMDTESVFNQMKEQLSRMRTRTARLDDLTQGHGGGAVIPPVASTFRIRVRAHTPVESSPSHRLQLSQAPRSRGRYVWHACASAGRCSRTSTSASPSNERRCRKMTSRPTAAERRTRQAQMAALPTRPHSCAN